MKNETKKVYTTPRVTVHGDAAQITLQTTTGTKFDRNLNGIAVTETQILFTVS